MSNKQPTSNNNSPTPMKTFKSDISALEKQGFKKEDDKTFSKENSYEQVVRSQRVNKRVWEAIQKGRGDLYKFLEREYPKSKGYQYSWKNNKLIVSKKETFKQQEVSFDNNLKTVRTYGKDNKIDDREVYDSQGRLLIDFDYDVKGNKSKRIKYDYEKGLKEIKTYDDGSSDEMETFKLIDGTYRLIESKDYEKGRTRQFDPITGKIIEEKDRVTASERSKANKTKSQEELRKERGARTEELQSIGLTRSEAAEIALREQKGQKITSIREETARKVVSKTLSGELGTSAFNSEELVKALPSDIGIRETEKGLQLIKPPKLEQAKRATEIDKVLREGGVETKASKGLSADLARKGFSADQISVKVQEAPKLVTSLPKLESSKKLDEISFTPSNVPKGLIKEPSIFKKTANIFSESGAGIVKTVKFAEDRKTPLSATIKVSKFFGTPGLALLGKTSKGQEIIKRFSDIESPKSSKELVLDPQVQTSALVLSSPLVTVKSIGAPIAMALTAQKGTEAIGTVVKKKSFDESILKLEKDPRFLETFKEAKEEQLKEIGGFKAGLTKFIPTSFAFTQKKPFLEKVEATALEKGFTRDEARGVKALAEQRLAFKESGELAGLLAAGATTERIGAAKFKELSVTQSFTPKKQVLQIKEFAKVDPKRSVDDILKGASTLAKQQSKVLPTKARSLTFRKEAFKIIAPLGVGEGAAESITTSIASDEKIKPGQVLAFGAIGGLTAGLIGQEIAAKSVKKIRNPITGKVKQSRGAKFLELGANIADITEKPGDLIADFTGKAIKAPSKIKARVSTAIATTPLSIASTALSTDIILPSSIPTITETPKVKTPTSISSFSLTSTPVKTQTKISVPSLAESLKGSMPQRDISITETPKVKTPSISQVMSPVNVISDTNVPSLSEVSSPSITQTPASVTTDVPSITQTPASVTTSTITSVPTSTTVFVPKIPILPSIRSKTKSVSGQGYVAEVKSRGKFFTPEKKVLSKKDALALGSFYVDNTASAQFRLKKVKGTPKPLGESIAAFNSRKYRNPKRGGSSYIEKNEFRIDTPGELKGITAKGLAKQRAKKLSNSLFGGLNL